jgi:hypothetical protein
MVHVLGKRKKPLMPCSLKRARQLLDRGRARVHKRLPFTIRLVDPLQEDSVLQPLSLKIDPGGQTTGISLVREAEPGAEVVSLIELEHRGEQIKKKLKQRAAFRRRRRSANLRYRSPRFNNRCRKKGSLPPSLQHRVDSTLSIVNKLPSLAPPTIIAQELVRFDTELIEKPEIPGVEYQQGTLAGYEVRKYLIKRWGRKCVYCDAVNVSLNLDHVIPRSEGGSDRASNLVPACMPLNPNQGPKCIKDFLAKESVHRFQTGDHVRAVVRKGKRQGISFGRGSLRETGSTNLKTSTATVEGVNPKHCRLFQRGMATAITSSPIFNA